MTQSRQATDDNERATNLGPVGFTGVGVTASKLSAAVTTIIVCEVVDAAVVVSGTMVCMHPLTPKMAREKSRRSVLRNRIWV